jgi:tripartite-type tricarboxylate transporter receptor subunit TctC
MSCRRVSGIGLTLTLFALAFVCSSNAEEFYAGRDLKVIVTYNPGGGYDTYSRVIARHLPVHIPGKPGIIVQNMPGAAGVIGTSYLYRIAPKDGSTVGALGPILMIRQVVEATPGLKFESDKFNWLAAANGGDVMTCIARSGLGVKNLDDAIKRPKPLIIGATAPSSSTTTWARVFKEILGANFKIITGYSGTAGIRAAMDRGELDGGCWQWSSVKVTAGPMLEEGRAVVFAQLGVKKAPSLARVENAFDRLKAEDRSVVTTLLTETTLGRPYAAPPDVPADRVQILRKGFMETLKDPKLLAEAKRLGLQIDPIPGEELQKQVSELANLPLHTKERVKAIME